MKPPINNQNNPLWSKGKKSRVTASYLLVERAKFDLRVIVSAGVCFEGKGRLHFTEEKLKLVNAGYYMNDVLPKLVEDCHVMIDLLGDTGWRAGT